MASQVRKFANQIGAAWTEMRSAADDPERARELLAKHRQALDQFEDMLSPADEQETEETEETEEEGE